MRLDIEIVGERCKPKPQDRLPDTSASPPPFSPAQRPSTPDTLSGEDHACVANYFGYDGVADSRHFVVTGRHAVRRRPATVGAKEPPSYPYMWSRTPVHSRGATPRRRLPDDSISAARFEKGKRILISYFDKQGHVHAQPRSAMLSRSSLKERNGCTDPNNNHVTETESTVSISAITNRLYHRSRNGSAVEKAFTHDSHPSSSSTEGSPTEESYYAATSSLTKASSTTTSMPSLNRSQPFLITTPISTTDMSASASHPSQNGDTSFSTAAGEFHLRPITTSPGKRVHFNVDDSVKERLRTVYAARRAYSASGGRWVVTGPMDAPRGRSRRWRRPTAAPQVSAEARDENAPPPVSRMYRKFRMVGLIAMTLVRLQAAIVVNSLDRTVRSASEIQWRTLYGEQEAEKLAFNKSLFSRERISTKMPRWALRIFEVAPEERTEQDCRRLHALFRGMRSFGKFTEQIQLSLCRAFSYTCVGESRIVLRRGHIGHNFYFVYSGSVFVNVQDVDSDGNPFIKTEAILGRGDSFGELALLQDIRRTATISVRETCELLVVDKDVFAKVCPKIFEKELMEKQNFISRLPLFSSKWWGAEDLRSLCMEAQIQEYKINKIVVEDNTIEDWLYICMEGKCQIIRCLSLEAGQDEPTPVRSREPSVVLSEEIIELLASATGARKKEERESEDNEKSESSKEKLLSSLGLEYLHTGKRRGAFIEEVEAEERRKALMASSGPMTLTSLMAQQQREGKTGLVYLNVGSLEAEGVFDMSSLIKAPVRKSNSTLLLVSSGARMLRLKKKSFHNLASPQAVEHTRTLISKEPMPSEAALLDSYKKMVTWDQYKHEVIKDVMKSRDIRGAAAYRDDSGTPQTEVDVRNSLERSQTSHRLLNALNRFTDVEKKRKKRQGQPPGEGQSQGEGQPQGEGHTKGESDEQGKNSGTTTMSGGDNNNDTTRRDSNSVSETNKPIFPVVELDHDPSKSEETPRGQEAPLHHLGMVPEEKDLDEDESKRPSAVIVRRRSSVGSHNRPLVSGETAFVMRRRSSSSNAPKVSLIVESDLSSSPEQ